MVPKGGCFPQSGSLGVPPSKTFEASRAIASNRARPRFARAISSSRCDIFQTVVPGVAAFFVVCVAASRFHFEGFNKISSARTFPDVEYDNMINSLSTYAQIVQANLPEPDRKTELALILDALETALLGAGRKARDWPAADALHDLLVKCIVRRKGQAEFSDAVTNMLASVQAYELARGGHA